MQRFYFLCQHLSTLRANGWTDLHEISRKGVELPWDDLITFLVNSEKPRAMPRCATRGRGLLCFSTTACCYLYQVMLVIMCSGKLSSITRGSVDEAVDDKVDSSAELSSAAEEEPVSVEIPRFDDELSSFFISATSVPEDPDQQEKEEASVDTFNDIFIDSNDMYVRSAHNKSTDLPE